MKSLIESILDSGFENTVDKAYEKRLKNLTELRDSLVKFIDKWHKLDKDGDGYSTDDWEMGGGGWWDIRTHILLEFKRLIKKHHLDDILTAWGNNTRSSDSVKIINKDGSRLKHISMIDIECGTDPDPDAPYGYASVWIEDPRRFLEMMQK